MRVRIGSVLTTAALAVVFLGPAKQMRADTVFTNFGPGQTYQGNSWWTVGTTITPPPGTEVNAFPFVPGQTATLTGADLALAAYAAVTPLNVYIESNSGGAPGAILDTLTQTGTYSDYPTTSVVSFACTGTCTTLDAGTTYWIVGQQSDPANTTFWMYSFNDTGSWYYNLADSATGPWSAATAGDTLSAFDVTGVPGTAVPPVPEPGSLALLGSGLVGIFAVARRKFARA